MTPTADHYETLQVSPRADRDTIERVFRLLAKRYHPDNPESGDPDRFAALVEAFRTLSDPEARARYDATYEDAQRARWRTIGQADAADAGADRRVQGAVLTILYRARRADPDRPGVGIMELERLLECPEDHMRFHLWYLREHGWIQRLENGTVAVTADGVDRVLEGEPRHGAPTLKALTEHPAPRAAAV